MKADQRVFISVILIGAILGCDSSVKSDFKYAEKLINKKEFNEAIVYLDQTILRDEDKSYSLEAARVGARVALLDLKDFKKAVQFNKYIVLNSNDPTERINSQKLICKILFENLNDYKNSIIEINRLLGLIDSEIEKEKLEINLAKSYYYLNNFNQSESEATQFLLKNRTEDGRFQMMVLKGNIYLAKKEITKATEVFKQVLDQFTERATKENVGSILSVAYEEMKDYKSAVEVLEKIRKFHPLPEYIDLRIKRIKENQKNQPGANLRSVRTAPKRKNK